MSEVNTPFVFPFETANAHYVFDVNTNRVFAVDPVLHAIVERYGSVTTMKLCEQFADRFSEAAVRRACTEIAEAQEEGFFLPHRAPSMAYGAALTDVLATERCEQLILNLTERCNLRCAYCVYSGKYAEQRTHSSRDMPENVARKAIDFATPHAADDFYLGFYGGEPLLAFDHIKALVTYASARLKRKINFSLTTNATLLDREKIDFFVKHDFSLTVSLDGPAEVHDRYRRTADGNGTFRTVLDRLRSIQKAAPEYYKNKVLFSVVHAPPLRLNEAADFFENQELVRHNVITSTYVDYASNRFLSEVEDDTPRSDTSRFLNRYRDASVAGQPVPNYSKEFYDKNIVRFYKRPKTRLDSIFPNGCCVPGKRRLFVDVDGRIHVCERMDSAYPIGTIEEGIDEKRIRSLVNEYLAMSESCLDCWACRLCSNCFASYVSAGRMDAGIRASECEAVREKWKRTLVLYYSILEKDMKALDHLEHTELA